MIGPWKSSGRPKQSCQAPVCARAFPSVFHLLILRISLPLQKTKAVYHRSNAHFPLKRLIYS